MEIQEDYVVEGTQLSMVGRDALSIPPDLGITYGPNILRLDLSLNRLRDLEGIQGFTELRELILDGNEIGDDVIFPVLEYIHTLTMNKNKVLGMHTVPIPSIHTVDICELKGKYRYFHQITNLESLLEKISTHLPSLTYLSLLGNTACPNELSNLENDEADYQRYRYFVLHKLPNLKFLDSKRVTRRERQEGLKRGPFLKVVAPGQDTDEGNNKSNTQKESYYTPLPPQLTDAGDHHGTYSRSRYVYVGKHSEGNRFIRNSDL